MKDSSANRDAKPPTPVAPEDLVKEFRAYLHLVITAGQMDRTKQLEALPGSQMAAYCRALAEMPGNTLAAELSRPIRAIFEQIKRVANGNQAILAKGEIVNGILPAERERILEQLDFALALIMRDLPFQVRRRADVTQCRDLLCDAIYHLGIGDGVDAARWIRRWQKESPEDGRREDGTVAPESFPDYFAWDAYQRIAALDELADEFPEHVKTAAQRMHAWPMLMHRHTSNRRRFKQLASRLELGTEYPMDATEGARWRPDTPWVRYLDPLVYRLHYVRTVTADSVWKSADEEKEALRMWWMDGSPWERPDEAVVEVLRALRPLPPLTKVSAASWAEKVLTPLILATDARDWKNCQEPVLQRIAKQKGVKSRATFKSRLLAAVTATLRRLARPA